MRKQLVFLFLFLLPLFSWAQEDTLENNENLILTGPNGLIRSTSFLEDGKILIAGEFTSFDGLPYGRIDAIGSGYQCQTVNYEVGSEPTVTTEKDDYAPWEIAFITGTG